MKTRIAPPGSPLRQERFSSSPRFVQGLSANLVARRCEAIVSSSDRAPIWDAQERSWREQDGLEGFAYKLIAHYPKGTFRETSAPSFYDGVDYDKSPSRRLADRLSNLCLNPDVGLGELWNIVDDYRTKWIEKRANEGVQTEIGKLVADALTFAQEAPAMVVINGVPGLGKSHAARQFCELSGGLMRYVSLRSTTDMSSFFRTIGEALGLATNLNLKAQVLDERIQDTLASGDVGLCFDEGHWLFPQGRLRCAYPAKLNWIISTLCNRKLPVPVAILTTPQWDTAQAELERQTAWSSAQLKGRIDLIKSLPKNLSDSDLRKVAACIFPGAAARIIDTLVGCSKVSKENLRPIVAIAKRAAWLAQKAGRETASQADVAQAIRDNPVSAYLTEKKSPDEAPTVPARARRGGFAAHPRPRGGITTKIFSRSSGPALELVET